MLPISDPAAIAIATTPPSISEPVERTAGLVPPSFVRAGVRLAESAIVVSCALATAAWWSIDASTALALALYGAIVMLAAYEVSGVYRSARFATPMTASPRLVAAWAGSFVVLAATAYASGTAEPGMPSWFVAWSLATIAVIGVARAILAALVRHLARTGALYRRAVIYGASPVTVELVRALEADMAGDIRIAGIFDDRADERVLAQIHDYRRLGKLKDLIAFSRSTRVDLVVVALPVAGEKRLASVVDALSILPVDVKLPANSTVIRFAPRTYSRVGSVAMIDLWDKPMTDWGRVAKAVFDKCIALAAVVVFAPVMAAVAVAVRLESKGPIIFRQKRYGFNNELIEVFKFRSMYVDMSDAAAARLVTKDDPRVTRVGRFIRKTSLDELPQLFNVLTGSLSLVGPRPHALQAKAAGRLYDEAVDGYFARHKVKPGITGWAQVNGWRGETDTPEKIQKRVEHDLQYVENWSPLFDLYILLRTPWSLLNTQNAY
jgi:Undecaprenyl-phosphate glucose phosphotransferase